MMHQVRVARRDGDRYTAGGPAPARLLHTSRVTMWAMLIFLATTVGLGQPSDEQASAAAEQAAPAGGDPYEAYGEERFADAARGFERLKQRQPENPVVDLNLGSARYKLGEFEAANRAYEEAATAEDRVLRSEAVYNLGNTAYREGRLADAIERFTEALDLNTDDVDAKYNLEFVRRELEQQQQEQQQGESSDGEDSQEGESNGDQQSQSSGESDEQEGEQNNQDEQSGEQRDQGGADSERDADEDEDGLSDEQERQAENPTDPSNPDSDGDGRSDGEEDRNRNGKVDPGETDPNEPDPAPEQRPEDAAAQEQDAAAGRQMTPAEAQRFLQALQEERPLADRKARAAKLRQEKDW